MKNKLFILTFLLGAIVVGAHAQSISKTYGEYCVESEMVFTLTGPNCGSFSWHVANATLGTDYDILYNSSTLQGFRVKWKTVKSGIVVSCDYVCNTISGNTDIPAFSIGSPITPTVSLSLSQSSVCKGSSVTLTANPTHPGSSPSYQWYIGSTYLGTTSGNTFSLNTASYGAGTHAMRVLMNSNALCRTIDQVSSLPNDPENLTINDPQNFTAVLNGPVNTCANTTTGTLAVVVSGGGGNLTYKWYRTDIYNQIGETLNNNILYDVPISNGDVFFCRIFSDGCYNSPVQTNSHTVVMNQMVTPTVGINLPKLNYCTGETMQLTAASPYINGSTTFVWNLSGYGTFATSQSTSILTSDAAVASQFNNGDVITVTAYGLSGSCLSSSTASGSTSSVPIVLSPTVTPDVTLKLNNQTQNITLCQDATITLTATGVAGGSAPIYSFYIDGVHRYTGSSTTYSISASSFASGPHSAYVTLTSNAICRTKDTDTSDPFSFSINQPPVSVTLNGPLNSCANVTTGTLFAISSGGDGPHTYKWYKNNNNEDLGETSVNQRSTTFGNNDVFFVRVYTNGCANQYTQSNNYTTLTTPMVEPTVGINLPKLNYCAGETMSLTAFSPYGGSSYAWSLSGHGNFSTNQSTSLVTTSNVNQPLAYNTGDVITLTVYGLSGTCLTSTQASVTSTSTPITVISMATPEVTLQVNDQSQNITVCENTNVALKALPVSGGTAPIYTFYIDNVQRYNGTQSTFTTNTLAGGPHTARVTMVSNELCLTIASDDSDPFAFAVNRLPVANAGSDITLTLPQETVTITGTFSDPDGTTPTVEWLQHNYNGIPVTLSGAATQSLSVTGLEAGTHEFKLRATDQCGNSPYDHMTMALVYPDNNMSYVIEEVVQVPGITVSSGVDVLDAFGKAKVISYVDGVGKPYQTVTHRGSPGQQDIVQPHRYDPFGREEQSYLPFVSSATGAYRPNSTLFNSAGDYIGEPAALYAQNSNNKIADDSAPYTKTVFEPSPLNRPLTTTGPGEAWHSQNKSQQVQLLVNTHGTDVGQEEVIAWTVDASGMPVRRAVTAGFVVTGGYYDTNILTIKVTKDEEGNEVREYADRNGQMILKRVQAIANATQVNHTTYASTYYIYDDFGNLVVVLPPEAVKQLTTQE